MKHLRHECIDCTDDRCMVCVGGLNGCRVCGTWECEVPKDCPGYELDESQREAICRGDIDFVDGQWVSFV